MRIGAVQSRPFQGDVRANVARHKQFIELAAENGADGVFFPELSLTGYEPALARELAVGSVDTALSELQRMSDTNRITVGVGLPTRSGGGVCISLALLQPDMPTQIYSKHYLHPDEEPFFVPGRNIASITINDAKVAPAICYEISIPEHAARASAEGAAVYVASVAKFVSGIDRALQRLAEIAGNYAITVLMANCVGVCDGCDCAGRTSIWNHEGELLRQLSHADEGLLIFDTSSQEVIERTI
jgi:predicted amidohydrolase